MVSQEFFTINFSISIFISLIGLIFSLLMICFYLSQHRCRTVTNLLTSNTSLLILFYSILNLISSIYGFREDWSINQHGCLFRAYLFIVICGSICYSYLISAISRFFFVVYPKHRYLLNNRTHLSMIIINWIIGIVYALEPLFFDGAYIYESESRLCTLTTQKFSTSMFAIVTGFVIPLIISIGIYLIILHRIHRSSRRINVQLVQTLNNKREILVARNMIILGAVFAAVGTPYLLLVLWNGIQSSIRPPDSLYLLSINSVSFFFTLMNIALFQMNKQYKQILLAFLQRR